MARKKIDAFSRNSASKPTDRALEREAEETLEAMEDDKRQEALEVKKRRALLARAMGKQPDDTSDEPQKG